MAKGLMAIAGVAPALLVLRGRRAPREKDEGGEAPALGTPIALRPALGFALLIAVVTLLARILGERFGSAGLYALAAVSGLADVDAITIAAAQQSAASGAPVATTAIVIAVPSNTPVKTVLAWRPGGAALGRRAGAMLAALLALAFAGLLLPAPGR